MELYALNFPNGKKYIGVSVNAKRRFTTHRWYAARGALFPVSCAIRKYDVAGIKLEILCIGSDEYIKEMEIKAIAAFQTQSRRFGYNATPGGDGAGIGNKLCLGKRWKCSAETRAKVSASKLGNQHTLGRKMDKRTADALLVSNKARKGEFWITDGTDSKKCKADSLIPEGWSRGRIGHTVSEQTRAKMSASHLKRHYKK